MNDNERPHDSLIAAQFNRPALLTNWFQLNGANRTQGEFFPNIAGDFLRVDAVDYPCRISFNNADYDQSVPLLPGMMVTGQFSGVTLWHDDLSTTTTLVRVAIKVARGGPSLEADSLGILSAQGLPSSQVSATTTVSRRDFIVPYGTRQMRINGYALWGNAATPNAGLLVISALNGAGALQTISSISRNGINYSTTVNRIIAKYVNPMQTGAAQWAHVIDETFSIPTWAERILCSITISAAATSNDGMDFVATAR